MIGRPRGLCNDVIQHKTHGLAVSMRKKVPDKWMPETREVQMWKNCSVGHSVVSGYFWMHNSGSLLLPS